ncbi:MAG TPA: 30S ribosomal protein S6 [Solirubrobacteraceae bacterium]|nr:30S ribosomal protein S6 [Solirubrobacteraceae bacterium]
MPALYDLMLLLDSAADFDRRSAIVRQVEDMITGGGEIVGRHDWGVRPLAYEIEHKTDADYHLIQFHGAPAVLESLQHTLHITDDVVRFRIIKLEPGTPPPPDMTPVAAAVEAPAIAGEGEGPAPAEGAPEALADPAAEHAPAPATAE